MRGDVDTALPLASLPSYRASEDPQEHAQCVLVDAFVATAAGQRDGALQAARSVIDVMAPLGLGAPVTQLAWPNAIRTAIEMADDEAVTALLAAIDAHPIGHVPPLLRAERLLADAKRGASRDPAAAHDVFDAAIAQFRAFGSPFHLAHALLDAAEYEAAAGTSGGELVAEAEAIATRLGCRPLLVRTEAVRAALATV
jgi:hypothetical protein